MGVSPWGDTATVATAVAAAISTRVALFFGCIRAYGVAIHMVGDSMVCGCVFGSLFDVPPVAGGVFSAAAATYGG